ncbi:MAG TPA: FAD-binding oxidoreductase [Patescibacteria group bacterium]
MKINIYKNLEKIVGAKYVSESLEDKKMHSKDKSYYKAVMPDVVVWPKNTKEVSEIAKLCYENNIPLTPWGGGTSLMGNSIPVKNGVVINLTKMNKILEISSEGFQVTVGPGIICDDLNEELKKYKLFFPPFPGSSHIATIGGMIATNAGGMYAVKYGVTKDWVMQLEVVLANGEIITVGSKSIKSVAGYNLLPIFIGSSGTLGIVTKAVLKVCPLPEFEMAAVVAFQNLSDLSSTIGKILASHIKPAALELMDVSYVRLANMAQKKVVLVEMETLLIELHGPKIELQRQLLQLETICRENNAITYNTFTTPSEVDALWGCRKGVRIAFQKLSPEKAILSAEVGVPLQYVPHFIKNARDLQGRYNTQMLNHGHVGDGNFHTWVMYDMDNKESFDKAHMINDELIKFAIRVGGTATGEHGLGVGKKEYLSLEHPTTIGLMKEIKKLLDPKGILNPGKIFPD